MVVDNKNAPLNAKNNFRFKGFDLLYKSTMATPKTTDNMGAKKLIIRHKN